MGIDAHLITWWYHEIRKSAAVSMDTRQADDRRNSSGTEKTIVALSGRTVIAPGGGWENREHERMTRPFLLPLALVAAVFTSMTCRQPTQPPGDETFALSLSDVTCTEAWLNVHLGASSGVRTVEIRRDSGVELSFNLRQTDTTVADTGLLPNRVYGYRADLTNGPAIAQSTGLLSARTLDTTSSNFTFQTFTFGGNAGSCDLKDVAIINDTLAYAVGAIYLNDSTTGQPDPQAYSIAKWDGRSWSLMKLFDNSGLVVAPIRGIFVVNSNDIWLAAGSVYNLDGMSPQATMSFSRFTLSDPSATVEKLWGISASSLYGVGDVGTNIHYNGTAWTPLTSGTTQTIQDIWGAVDAVTGKKTILCAASHPLGYGDKEILSIDANNVVTSVPWSPQAVVMSAWFMTPSFVYACGAGIYRRGPDQVWREIGGPSVLNALTEHIRGQGNNDIFIAGDFGNIAHYNGVSFRLYPEVTNTVGTNSVFRSCAVKNNMAIAVGFTSVGINTAAVIAVGKR